MSDILTSHMSWRVRGGMLWLEDVFNALEARPSVNKKKDHQNIYSIFLSSLNQS